MLGQPDQIPVSVHEEHVTDTVSVKIQDLAVHLTCPICLGILSDVRVIPECMHRFCKHCIETWFRSQKDNICPQCRITLPSRRSCKPDPVVTNLVTIFFPDAYAVEELLQPRQEILDAARAMGTALAEQKSVQQAVAQKELAAAQRAAAALLRADSGMETASGTPPPPPQVKRPPSGGSDSTTSQEPKRPKTTGGGTAQKPKSRAPSRLGATTPAGPSSVGPGSQGAAMHVDAFDPSSSRYHGTQFILGKWQAYLIMGRNGGSMEKSFLGQYATEEEAARAHDLHLLRNKGFNASGFNFDYLIPVYRHLLSNGLAPSATAAEYEIAAPKIAAAVAGHAPPAGWRPPLLREPSLGGRLTSMQSEDLGLAAGAATPIAPDLMRREPSTGGAYDTTPVLDFNAAVGAYDDEPGARRARELAGMFALDLHLDGRLGPAAVFVRLVPREGASPHGVWRMRYLACPADTTLAQVKRAIAAGLGEQWAAGHAARAAITSEGIFLDAASELDAKADFSLLYGDPEGLGGMGEPFLRDELTLRMLCLLLANCGEDLKLEYLVTV